MTNTIDQARIIDISRYWRTGGIDWKRLKENFDGVIISAGVGMRIDVLLPEHIEKAKEHDVPYATFHIPDPKHNLQDQAKLYAEQPGVKEAVVIGDWENPYIKGGRECSAVEFQIYLLNLDDYADQSSWIYSRVEILKKHGSPDFGFDRKYWNAQYLYDDAASKTKFKYYKDFFARHAGKYPPAVKGTKWQDLTVLWQMTDFGDARFYCANRLTEDPHYVYGMTRADLNVSTMPKAEFMELFTRGAVSPPVVVPDPEPSDAWTRGYGMGYKNGYNIALSDAAVDAEEVYLKFLDLLEARKK